MVYVDFHLHTIYSDGSCPAQQIVRDASEIGIDVIAITDHDNVKGYFDALKEAKNWGIEVIAGVEISTQNYHILGLGLDPKNLLLNETLAYSRDIQAQIVKQRVQKLQNSGVPITFEKLLNFFPDARLGKGNLVTAMIRDSECREVIGNLGARGVYEKYFLKGGIARGVEPVSEVTPKEAIDAIHNAGGLAFIAHPFKDIQNIRELEELVKLGIDGLEIQPNYGDENIAYRQFAKEKGLLITYGSDYHGARLRDRPLLKRGENNIERFW